MPPGKGAGLVRIRAEILSPPTLSGCYGRSNHSLPTTGSRAILPRS